MSIMTTIKESKKRTARIAGLFYVIAMISAGFSFFVRDSLVVAGDTTTTANNIVASELLFRLSLLGDIIMMGFYLFLGLMLYNLFKDFNKNQATLMLAFILVALPVMFINLFSHFAALSILNDPEYLNTFNADQLHSLSLFFLDISGGGGFLFGMLIGPWLFPLGYLVYKSGYFPKFLGVLLILAGLTYVLEFTAFILLKNYSEIINPLMLMPAGIIEVFFAFWLLIKGVKTSQ